LGDNKRDLTRIEDLEEFIHELSKEGREDEPEEESTALFGESEDNAFSEEVNFSSDTQSFQSDFSGDDATRVLSGFDSSDSAESETSFQDSDYSETSFESESLDTPVSDFSDSEEDKTPLVLTTLGEDFFGEEESSVAAKESTQQLPVTAVATPTPGYQPPETFEEVKKFAENSMFSGSLAEGNPSFSLLIKNVRFLEDVNDILILLREYSLLNDSEESTKARLMRGNLLIPRISEFTAIYLAHRLRRFDIDIQMGLSDEIHPPRHQELPEVGIVSKASLYQNQNHYFHFDDPKLELSQIIVSASPSIEGYQVVRYVGVASEHKLISGSVVEDETSDEIPQHYQELAQKLKVHALRANTNAVVGLNYQLTPLPTEVGLHSNKYRLTCTGNLVWVNKL
jgi:uncharacterized protein YbjQ (UPF0145 family)